MAITRHPLNPLLLLLNQILSPFGRAGLPPLGVRESLIRP
jgi:hypothetical protein